jgi:hypothetical protein
MLRAVVLALALSMSATTAFAQAYERPVNPLRMQGGGWLGVVFANQPVAAGGSGGLGVVVSDVAPGGPGSTAGFARGDVLTEVGRLSVRDVLAQAHGTSMSPTEAVNEALTGLSGVSRVKFVVVRGGQRVDLFAELTGSPERRLLFFTIRERSTQQLRRLDAATTQLSGAVPEYEQIRLTGSLGPIFREYNKLLQDIINTGDADVLDALLNDATNDRRLEVFHRLIAFLQFVGARRVSIPSSQIGEYRAFDANLKTLVPSRAHFNQTVGALTPRQLYAARAALRFIEPYEDAKERLAQVDLRIAAHEATTSQDGRLVALKGELLSALQSGVRNQELEDRIARLPPDGRRAMENFRRQMLARRGESEAAELKRKQDEAAAEAERRKRDEANDAIFQQLKEAKRQKEERERQERERLAAEQSSRLREYGATHVTYGEDVWDNPFQFEGQTVCFKDVRFKRMIDAGVGVFQTRSGRELVIRRVPVDAFKRAGQRNSVLAKIVATPPSKTSPPGPRPLQLTYVALLPEADGN